MGDPPTPQIDPAMLAQGRQAQTDQIAAIRDRVSNDTRDTLIRFGRRKAFAGTGDLGGGIEGMTKLVTVGTPPAEGLFPARRLDMLRSLGRV